VIGTIHISQNSPEVLVHDREQENGWSKRPWEGDGVGADSSGIQRHLRREARSVVAETGRSSSFFLWWILVGVARSSLLSSHAININVMCYSCWCYLQCKML